MPGQQEAALIQPEKIEEWVREVEERPSSAPLIIRFITARLEELTRRNDELRAENIALSTEKKVAEYEARITALEYQLALLKRHLSGDINLQELEAGAARMAQPAAPQTLSALIFSRVGRILRLEFQPSALSSGMVLGELPGEMDAENPPGLLVAGAQEELLLAFDSGRSLTMPLSSLPPADPGALDWRKAFVQPSKSTEELAVILPIAAMPLHAFCVQTSRKGFVRRVTRDNFEKFLPKNYVGSGTTLRKDRMCGLTLADSDDRFVMVSREGWVFNLPVTDLPVASEEVLRLYLTDYIVAAFELRRQTALLVATQVGKVVHRDVDWLEPAASFHARGQPVYSKERREAGVRVVGAAAVDETDWALSLRSDGRLVFHSMQDLFDSGTLLADDPSASVLAFAIFR